MKIINDQVSFFMLTENELKTFTQMELIWYIQDMYEMFEVKEK